MADPYAAFSTPVAQEAADPYEAFAVKVAQAPRVRPDPIQRPDPIERPGSVPPQRRQTPVPPPQRAAPPPAATGGAQIMPGKGGEPEPTPAPAVGMTEEPVAGPGRFAKQPGTPPLHQEKIGDYDVKQIQGILDKADPKLREAILKEWADDKVKTERAQGGMKKVATWIDDRVRTVARGTPVGSWLDETNAALYTLAGIPYDLQLAYERAKDRARDSEASTMFNIPGTEIPVTTATGEKLLGALGSSRLFPQATLMQGASYLPRAVNATATGAGYGAVYGAGEGDGMDRLTNMAIGTAVGGALGPVIPAVQNVVTAPVNALARYLNRPQGAIQGVNRQAAQKVADSIEQDGVAASYPQQRQALGPEGMLADMGDNLRMDAARIARNPGDGRSTVLNALSARGQGAQGRINTELDTAIGSPIPLPQSVERIRKAANAQAAPQYDQFYQTPIPYTQDLVTVMQRVPKEAYLQAAKMADMKGYDLSQIMNTGRGLDYVKRALDDISYAPNTGRELAAATKELSKMLRNAVDDILSPGATPATRAQSPWAQARAASGEGLRFERAAEQGGNAFSKALSPDQMRFDTAKMGFNERSAYDVGARDQLHQMSRNASSNFGPTGDNALRRLINAPNAQDKLAMIAGRGGARDIVRRVNAETAFARTEDDALRNSITSTMAAAGKKWPAPDGGAEVRSELMKSSLQGQAMVIAHRVVNSVRGNALNERLLREQADAARMLVAQGADRDAIAAALIRFARGNRLAGQRRAAIERVVRDLMQSPRPLAIEGATRE